MCIATVTVPVSKPKSLEAMLEAQRKGKENSPEKRANKILTDHIGINSVNVQIGMYKNFLSAEKDMPNILLLNIELLTGVDNSSIKIRKNKEKKYSIFVNKITYALAENLCVRTRSQETACNIFKN